MTEQNTPLRPRTDGWTAERQRVFIAVLADTGIVAAAAKRAGMSKAAAYALRRHPAAADFRAGWEAALVDAWRRVEETAMERCIEGEVDIYEKDGVTVTRRRPCAPQLMIHMLERAERARGVGPNGAIAAEPVDSASVARLRAEIRLLAAMDGDEEKLAAHWAQPRPPRPPPMDRESQALRRFDETLDLLIDRELPVCVLSWPRPKSSRNRQVRLLPPQVAPPGTDSS
ncbi:hypothetical protein [Sandarakinorhabdus sp.]|uniref:hypothetical protein n=1 Tax=Sandarakinorhabdus sp. TaxID=1916663 RepID=UPI00286E01CC|nr:hypothetical protein [Sandarakinorhabdus sp.]